MRPPKKLAASFVVTIAVLPGCKKTSDGEPEVESTASIYAAPDGRCTYNVPEHCPKGAFCNPPPPPEIDCPADKRDAAAPVPPSRRPPGKEDWVRVKQHLNAWGGQCHYDAEKFCSPPGKPYACMTAEGTGGKTTCTPLGDAGAAAAKNRVEAFTYKDVTGACHKVAAFTCETGYCDLPEGEIVPCS